MRREGRREYIGDEIGGDRLTYVVVYSFFSTAIRSHTTFSLDSYQSRNDRGSISQISFIICFLLLVDEIL